MTENYFGEPWPSGICDDGTQRPTPIGDKCLHCDEPIQDGDQGTWGGVLRFGADIAAIEPAHRECSLRAVRGGIGHLVDHDYWCDTEHMPDAGFTYRQSAIMVWELTINGTRPKFAPPT